MSESFNFKHWVLQQNGPYTIREQDEDHIHIENEYGLSEVNFYHLEEEGEIVELKVTCKKTNMTRFFLHFQPVHEEHAKDLFREMISSLLSLKNSQTTKVLLCCSAGMTTSFFAEKLNEVARMNALDYDFSAVGVQEVYAHAKDYDVVLVAPQVGYEEARLKRSIVDKLILKIPTQLFASYDAAGCLEFVRNEVNAFFQTKKKKASNCCKCNKSDIGKVLIISTAPGEDNTIIHYRIYENGEIILDRRVLKKTLDLEDIDDIIDTQVCQNTATPFKAISIALPGIVQDGKLDLPKTKSVNLQGEKSNFFNIQKYYEDCAGVPVRIENNANCAAYGWYTNQSKYQTVCLMSQPAGWLIGGQGIVVNGKLIRGSHGITGEIRYLLNQMSYETPLSIDPYNVKVMREITGKALLANISILDPEVIIVRNDMLLDVEEIKEELEKYLPASRIPEIIHMDDFNDYVMAGQERLLKEYIEANK
ncbi:ROK family protein [Bulleidia sp. HCP3S3_F2]|uniref:ROK family protein n=1 Tax=unclassified Bulleidia TaxID=2704656 RepID=UPI003F8AB6B0